MNNSKQNWFPVVMRLYLAKSITESGREIKCEKCGALENLEFHHTKYFPKKVTVKDMRILCIKCHRNSKKSVNNASGLKTIFKKGKRFCVVSQYKFAY